MGNHHHEEPQTRYVVLTDIGGNGALHPPPNSHGGSGHPKKHRRHHHDGNSCCCCICCCCCFFFLLIFLAIAALVAFLVYLNPKPPSYSITKLSISTFNLSSNLDTLHTQLHVTVRAENPNERIGITYEADSSVVLAFRGTDLCSGKLPAFYQGHHNVTAMPVVLDGTAKFGKEMQDDLALSQKSGEVPLDVSITVPVNPRIVGVDTKTLTVSVRGTLVLDGFDPHKKTGIKSSDFTVVWGNAGA